MDEVYLYHALRYVERNPVRAGIVDDPWDYPWSSAAFRVSRRAFDPLVEEDAYLRQVIGGDWREYLQGKTAEEILEELNSAARSNRVLGTPAALTSASDPRP
jgi:putative transposase